MSRETIARQARAFLIWREATSVKWQTDTLELSEALRIPRRAVQDIVEARGWGHRLIESPRTKAEARSRGAVDTLSLGLCLQASQENPLSSTGDE